MPDQKKGISLSSVVVIAVFVFLAGAIVGSSMDFFKTFFAAQVSKINSGNQDFTLYWDVYSKLKENYVDESKFDKDKLYYGTIRGMVDSLGDPVTVFFDPTETADFNKSQGGQYSGIGAELDYVNRTIVVVAPFDGSPAQKAGLEAGDIITKVDDKSVQYKTINEVITMIRGEAGTEVVLDVFRPRVNRPLKLTITRGNVYSPSMQIKEIKDGVAVVKISRFTESSLDEWEDKWDSIANELKGKYDSREIKSMVLDLRGNPGGFVDAGVYLSEDFLPQKSIVLLERGRTGDDEISVTTRAPRLPGIPMVILVNGGSASASEFFAGAMQFHKRATVLGDKTYGKGTAQIIIPIEGGSSLHVTVAKWLLPDKRWITHEEPITPDMLVPFDFDGRDKGTDNQLDKAKETAKGLE